MSGGLCDRQMTVNMKDSAPVVMLNMKQVSLLWNAFEEVLYMCYNVYTYLYRG